VSVPLRRLYQAFLLLLGVVVVGTIGYRFAGLTWTDALYQTVITVTTVGYSDLAPENKGFTIVLVVISTLMLAVLISVITGAFVELEIRDLIGRRKMEGKVRKLDKHYIVCGFGRFGRTIAEELTRKGVPYVVIESEPSRVAWAMEHDCLIIEADATEEETLLDAGIERSRGLLTTLGSDADNVYVTLTAKQMKRDLKVVAIALDDRAAQKLKAAGADEVVSPYRIGGNWMAQIITSPVAADFIRMATGSNPLNFYMDEQRIGEHSELKGLMLKETPIRRDFGAIVVGLRRRDGSLLTNPAPDIALEAGDTLVSLGEAEQLAALKKLARGPR
jgi:voltage-gated potassium channel